MGVHGLWAILSPSSRNVKIDSLRGKMLAVGTTNDNVTDVSIWLNQFYSGSRDRDPQALERAQLSGFFARLCRFLFFGIRPVLVFDGSPPPLKRTVILRRRAQRALLEERREKQRQQGILKKIEKTMRQELKHDFESAYHKYIDNFDNDADAGDEDEDEDDEYSDDVEDEVENLETPRNPSLYENTSSISGSMLEIASNESLKLALESGKRTREMRRAIAKNKKKELDDDEVVEVGDIDGEEDYVVRIADLEADSSDDEDDEDDVGRIIKKPKFETKFETKSSDIDSESEPENDIEWIDDDDDEDEDDEMGKRDPQMQRQVLFPEFLEDSSSSMSDNEEEEEEEVEENLKSLPTPAPTPTAFTTTTTTTNTTTIQPQQKNDQQLLHMASLFGIPFHQAPSEAEYACAALCKWGACDGVMTEDGDALLSGGRTGMVVYRGVSTSSGRNSPSAVSVYDLGRVFRLLSLTRCDLIAVAMLLGGDYCEGVRGIGTVTALAVLRFHNPNRYISGGRGDETNNDEVERGVYDSLSEFASSMRNSGVDMSDDWKKTFLGKSKRITLLSDFPQREIIRLYTYPIVGERSLRSDFVFREPQFDDLFTFASSVLQWSSIKSRSLLEPLRKKWVGWNSLEGTIRQRSIEEWIPEPGYAAIGDIRGELSKGIRESIDRLIRARRGGGGGGGATCIE